VFLIESYIYATRYIFKNKHTGVNNMSRQEILQIIGGHTADGPPLTTAEQIAALPPAFIVCIMG